MRYLSHLYFRTDATFGRYAAIEVKDGIIVSIKENALENGEFAATRFFSGVIVPEMEPFVFADKDDFLNKAAVAMSDNSNAISVGQKCNLMVVEGFDLTTFDGVNAKWRKI